MGRTSDARDRLLRSAQELMSTSGYNALGVKEICDHAEVNKGSFYHFFPSKRDLTLEVIKVYQAKLRCSLILIFEVDQPLSEQLRIFFEQLAVSHEASVDTCGHVTGCLLGNLGLELSTQEEEVRCLVQEVFEDLTQFFEQVIIAAIAAHEIPPQDPRSAAQALVAYMEGCTLLSKVYRDPSLFRQLAKGAITLVNGSQ